MLSHHYETSGKVAASAADVFAYLDDQSRLSVGEVVTERQPPARKAWAHKAWETIGTPRLVVVGHYRLGFDIFPTADQSLVRIFINYALPAGKLGRVLGGLFGSSYAKWCTRQMLRDATAHFAAA